MKTNNLINTILTIIFILSIVMAKAQNCTQCDNTVNPSGNYASEVGQNTTASGDYSFAGGINSTSQGGVSFAFGQSAIANGGVSFALGASATASNSNAYALGTFCTASGSQSFVLGNGLNSSTILNNGIGNSLMIGFNSDKPTLFVGHSSGAGTTGRTGIGNITNPTAKLHIKADASEDADILLMPGTSKYARIKFGETFPNSSPNRIEAQASSDLKFYTASDFVFWDGNMGIGNYNPAEKLDVNGNIKTTGFILNNGQQATGKILQSDANGMASWVDPMTLTVDDGDWAINGNDLYRLNGNVGIGTSTPNYKFEVTGIVKSTGFMLTDGNEANGRILQSDANGNASWTDMPPAVDDDWIINGGNIYRLNGNVVIGTSTPQQAKLYVVGDVTATGIVIANQMNIANFEVGFLTVTEKIEAAEIEVKNIAKWKDEVFEDNYPLPSLSKVGQYIEDYKHLPDMPSEAEILDNGYSVGEMDALLLQKIEELTLYVIEQQKEISELNKKLKQN